MSRRFGRNQKRRMRAEIAQTQKLAADYETAWKRECGLLRDVAQKRDIALERLRYMVEQIHELAPESHILPPGELLEIRVIDASLQAIVRIDPKPQIPVLSADDTFCGSNQFVRTIDVHKLVHAVERDPYQFQCRATVKIGDELTKSYAISGRLIQEKRMHPEMLRELCSDVARSLFREMGFRS